ncbi:uncharacterized protein LOC127151312 [Cucumis melo]|uniref:Uncharacterized protein LOC127151312 n=1 Tax=Cucumis melo TaxID=3656 RepID=A0ABM3L9P7_CUCME|nr:uncharacterized protein LOC127151312 [Cucumis melo]
MAWTIFRAKSLQILTAVLGTSSMSFFEGIEMRKDEIILKELMCFNLYDGKGISILFVVWISFLILQVLKVSLQDKKHLMFSMVKCNGIFVYIFYFSRGSLTLSLGNLLMNRDGVCKARGQ